MIKRVILYDTEGRPTLYEVGQHNVTSIYVYDSGRVDVNIDYDDREEQRSFIDWKVEATAVRMKAKE